MQSCPAPGPERPADETCLSTVRHALTPVKQTGRELAHRDWIISTSVELCN